MTFRVALESLKSDYSRWLERKTFQRLLREAAIGWVRKEEGGVASLMEVPNPSRSGRGQELRSSKGRHASLEQETDDGQKNTLRGCVQDSLSVTTVFKSLSDY
jgi:hypothetical protein